MDSSSSVVTPDGEDCSRAGARRRRISRGPPLTLSPMKRAFVLLLLVATPAFAQQLDSMIDQELPSLLATYKQLHLAPELSQHEEKSAALIATRLRELGYSVTERVGKYDEAGLISYGIVAVLKNGNGPTLYVRTDMDALPVVEQTGLAYASTVN